MKTLQEKIDAIIERQHSVSDVKLLIAIDSNEIDKAIQELREAIVAEKVRDEIAYRNEYAEGCNDAFDIVLALIGEKK